MIRVGIIGLGVGKHHFNALVKNPLCELTHVCDFDKSKLKEYRKKYPSIIFTENDNDIFDNKSIDLVSIASYDYFHYEQIIKSLNNKKNVFVEKPICLSNHELVNIFKVLNRNKKLQISSNLVLRTEPSFLKLKKNINNSKFGKIYYVEADYYWGRINKLLGWRSQFNYSIILGAAIHMIDLMLWVLEELPYKVTAFANKISTKSMKFKNNSFVIIILEFKNGLILKITGNGGCVHPHFHGIKIFSDKQTYIHDLNSTLKIEKNKKYGQKISNIPTSYPTKYLRKNIINNFIENLNSKNNNSIINKKEIYNLMKICFASEESLKKNKSQIIKY